MRKRAIDARTVAAVLLVSAIARVGDLAAQTAPFRRGDANSDGLLNLTDAVFTLEALFHGGPQPGCRDAADSNDDGVLDLTDGVHSLHHLFLGGPAPVEPFGVCGPDRTQDSLDCASFPACSRPQETVEVAWVARYNGPGNGDDYPQHLVIDAAGNIHVTGGAAGMQPRGKTGMTTVKYGPGGEELWVARYDEQTVQLQDDVGRWMAIDREENILVTGRSVDVIGGNNAIAHGYTTIKYDPEGRELWIAYYDGGNAGTSNSVSVDAANNVYVTGIDGTVKYDAGGRELWLAPHGGSSMEIDASGNVHVLGRGVTAKYSPDGRELWAVPHSLGFGGVRQSARRLALDSTGNVHVTGFWEDPRKEPDYATIKYDSSGREVWLARYDGPSGGRDVPTGLVTDPAGNVYVTGESLGIGTDSDYATVKYAPDGRELWVARHDGPGSYKDAAASIALDGAGNVYVTGISDGGETGPDFATIKYDPDGNEVWIMRFDGPGEAIPDERFHADSPIRLAVDRDGSVLVAGSSLGGPGYDYVTIKYVLVNGQ